MACLRNLTLDTCVAPDGSLVIATHSGGPDWGSGPGGKGTLYKVTYAAPDVPQPTAVWPASSTEVRVAFDRELDPAQLAGIGESISLTYGPYVRAGDRYEVKRPGYAVVAQQLQAPRETLVVHSVQLTPDRRTLLLVTDPHPAAVRYAVRLPWRAPEPDTVPATVRQDAVIEVDYALTGAQADWTATDGKGAWSGWLPHPDLAVARALTQGSADHDRFRELMRTQGMLSLSFQLDLQDMLRPAVQPGSQLDYEWPPEEVSVVVSADRPIIFGVPREAGLSIERSGDGRSSTLRLAPGKNFGRWLPLSLDLATGGDEPRLTLTWHTNEDDRPRALPLRRCFVPWAKQGAPAGNPSPAIPPELAGGSWERGRQLFFGDQAQCSKCHSVRGKGGRIGPDLSNLVHRDYASVLRDVTLPNYALNPDFVSYSVALTDGRVLTGAVKPDGDNLRIGDTKGVETIVARGDVETLVPQSISIMPEGLTKTIGTERVRDVLTYLLLPAPTMPRDLEGTPPLRTRRDVETVLAGAPAIIDTSRRMTIVLVAGPKDHGPGEHDYPAWQRAWRTLLGMAENVVVDTAWEWPSSGQFAAADVIVFYQHGSWNDDKAAQIDAFLARGGGLAYIHWAVDGGADFAKRIGLAWGPGAKFRHGPVDLVFDRDDRNPITRNFRRVEFLDESYWNLTGSSGDIDALASGDEEGQPQPLFWTHEPGQGRVFVSILGHYSWTFDDPLFRVLLLRGMAWAANEPVDRWIGLATIGVELRVE
jgi:putative heme-binding domain-containing protein